MVTPLQPKQVITSILEKKSPEIMTQPKVIPLTEQVPSPQNAQRQSLSLKVVTRQVPSYLDP